MKITNLAVRQSITVFSMMVIVVIMGTSSYVRLPREANPDVNLPLVMVFAPYFGSSPKDMENLVTRKIEKQLKGLPDLEEMRSMSSEGITSIILEFTPDIDKTDILAKVRDGVELAKPDLPQDVRDDLLVYELSSDDWPIMQVVVSADYDPVLLKDVAEDLQEELESIPGVIAVDLTGGVEREVRVDVDPDRLRFYGLGLVDLQDAIALENVTIPGGELKLGSYDYQVRVPGEMDAVEQILAIAINPAEDTPVYVRDVAEVKFGLRDRSSISRLEQRESVTLSVKKRSGANIIDIADTVNEMLEELVVGFPPGTELRVISDQSVYIRDMVAELQNNILSGLILVVGVLFLFLGLRNSFFVGVAIPFSMMIAFIILSAAGITLNMVVLFSLILALGMLVDNAIVIVENVFRHRVEGYSPNDAALKGTSQVANAVVASTLTTVSAFGPLIFWPGIMGEFMKYLPITVSVTLLASLIVALVFNPVLCARFMRIPKDVGTHSRLGDRLIQRGLRWYDPAIRWALRYRGRTIGGITILLIAVFMVFRQFNAGVELFPDVDPTYAFVNIEAPSGTRIEVSDAYAERIEEAVDTVPELHAYVTEVGASRSNMGGTAGAPPHLSMISMEFLKMEDRKYSSRDALESLRSQMRTFTGAEITIDKMENGPPTGKPITIEISGDDFERLGELADSVKTRIRGIEGVVDLQDDFDRGRPEIRIYPDLEKATRFGLRTTDVASTVRTALHGTDVSKFRVGEDEYDIVVRYHQPARGTVEDIEKLTVFYEGEDIPLTSFASVGYATGPGSIQRLDGKRVVTVSSDIAVGFNANEVRKEAEKQLETLALPRSYHLSFTGEEEEQEEAISFLSDAFMIAISLIFVILITQFGSVTTPFVILLSVVLSLIGVLVGLLVTRTPFGIIMTGVGVISLAGVVVNNAIVLLDYIIKLRNQGMEKMDAIIEAGRTRFRPVILTAVTTILGLIPLTTGFSINFNHIVKGNFGKAVVLGGESSQWWGPMGVAVIWGLAVATFLTLIVVPVMYASIDPVKRWFKTVFVDIPSGRRRRGRRGRRAEAVAFEGGD